MIPITESQQKIFSNHELLEDGVSTTGYIRLDKFYASAKQIERFITAMNKIYDADSMIIDLRENGGGFRLKNG